MEPTVIITRPEAQAQAFAQALDDAAVLIAPLVAIKGQPVTEDLQDIAHVIFTSVNGVVHAPPLPDGVTAWCVGDQTSAAAAAAGFAVHNARGTSKDLIALITDARPAGPILHLRGAHATGRVAETLRAAGLSCRAAVCYAQQDIAPSSALQHALSGTAPVICPVFSPRAAKRLAAAGPITAPLTLVAISAAALAPLKHLSAQHRIIAATPDKSGMRAAVHDAIAARRLEGRGAAY